MKIPNNVDIPRSELEKLIDEWIFNEQHRKMLKLNLLDGWTYEHIAEEFDMSVQQIKTIVYKGKKTIFTHVKEK